MLQSVAILFHPHRIEAKEEADWLSTELQQRGIRTLVGNGWDPQVVSACCDRDLLIALGGDGTILHVARLASSEGAPTLGVNLGRVGFLAALTPTSLHENISLLAEGQFWIEERAMLEVAFEADGNTELFLSLNEVAVGRGVSPRAVHVNTLLDGNEFMTWTADAVLVATATGSTAYSLAAGGPILYPESTDLLITPVAPHLHIGRSLVVPGDMKVSLRLSSDNSAVMTVDGSDERRLKPGDLVHAGRSKKVAHFARLGQRPYFYSTIAERLQ